MEFPLAPIGDSSNWMSCLDSVMLAAAVGYAHGQPPITHSAAASSSFDPLSSTPVAAASFYHFFQYPPGGRNHHVNLLTYHAAALQQHLATANQSFIPNPNPNNSSTAVQLPVDVSSSKTFLNSDTVTKKKAEPSRIGYSVAQLIGKNQEQALSERTTPSPHNSGISL